MAALKSPQPPFTKGGLLVNPFTKKGLTGDPLDQKGKLPVITSIYPPFIKGDTGGFLLLAKKTLYLYS